MSRNTVIFFFIFLSVFCKTSIVAQPIAPETENNPTGIWENDSRFVEFRPDGKFRIILKPYYGFVYEDTGWVQDSKMPRVQINNGLFLQYYKKIDVSPPSVPEPSHTVKNNTIPKDGGPPQSVKDSSFASTAPLNGFWLAQGLAPAIRLYKEENLSYLYGWYFDGSHYYRIRYWKTDVRFRNIEASFTSMNNQILKVPKFITFDTALYTCITSTGTILRNYEKGEFTRSDGNIEFIPQDIVFAGTEAEYRKPIKLTLSQDSKIFALGEPYLVRSLVTDIEAEITAHNGKRRKLRKPLLEFMDLDFRWDEIESIRNNGTIPE